MSARVKLASFAIALAAIFGLGFGVGALVGPFGEDVSPPSHDQHATADR